MVVGPAGEERFSHLLQPIRDIAANWNIDVACELEEYLDVLERVKIQIEDGNVGVNFAEAALLIQGSTNVYSKKVEFLHELVYKTLEEMLGNGRNGGKKATRRKREKSGEHGEEEEEDDLYEFLHLEDSLQDGKDISLVEEVGGKEEDWTGAYALHLDQGGMYKDGDIRNLKMVSCAMHPDSGALLLEEKDAPLLSMLPTSNRYIEGEDLIDARENVSGSPDNSTSYSDDHGGRYGECEVGMELNQPVESAEQELMNLDYSCDVPDVSDTMQADQEHDEDEECFDPLAPLDPSDQGTLAEKPFNRMRRTSRRHAVRSKSAINFYPYEVEEGLKVYSQNVAPEYQQYLDFVCTSDEFKQKNQQKSLGIFSQEEADEHIQEDETIMMYDDNLENISGDMYEDYTTQGEEPLLETFPEDTEQLGDSLAGAPAAVSYEDLCRAHVESALRAAAAYEVKTDLSVRVSEWKSRILPVLEDEEKRPNFDIRDFSNQLVSKMDDFVQEKVGDNTYWEPHDVSFEFKDMIKSLEYVERWDIPRAFLAMLQLANEGRVHIQKTNDKGNLQFSLMLKGFPSVAKSVIKKSKNGNSVGQENNLFKS